MITVELIYSKNCPNVKKARAELLRAFSMTGLTPHWIEWEQEDPSSPPYVKNYGSPTILINKKDITPQKYPTEKAPHCRIYNDKNGKFKGTPNAKLIAETLKKFTKIKNKKLSNWNNSLAVIPGITVSLLPIAKCPACWPLYAGILSSIGLGFLLKERYLLILTVFFLSIAVGSLAYKAKERKGYKPFITGLIAGIGVLVGKFFFNYLPIVYGSTALLFGASIWNIWPIKIPTNNNTCPACTPREKKLFAKKPGNITVH